MDGVSKAVDDLPKEVKSNVDVTNVLSKLAAAPVAPKLSKQQRAAEFATTKSHVKAALAKALPGENDKLAPMVDNAFDAFEQIADVGDALDKKDSPKAVKNENAESLVVVAAIATTAFTTLASLTVGVPALASAFGVLAAISMLVGLIAKNSRAFSALWGAIQGLSASTVASVKEESTKAAKEKEKAQEAAK